MFVKTCTGIWRITFDKAYIVERNTGHFFLNAVIVDFATLKKAFLSWLQVIIEAMASYKIIDRVKWVTSWPGQAVLCVSQFYWTHEVHLAIRGGPEVSIFHSIMRRHFVVFICVWLCYLRDHSISFFHMRKSKENSVKVVGNMILMSYRIQFLETEAIFDFE